MPRQEHHLRNLAARFDGAQHAGLLLVRKAQTMLLGTAPASLTEPPRSAI